MNDSAPCTDRRWASSSPCGPCRTEGEKGGVYAIGWGGFQQIRVESVHPCLTEAGWMVREMSACSAVGQVVASGRSTCGGLPAAGSKTGGTGASKVQDVKNFRRFTPVNPCTFTRVRHVLPLSPPPSVRGVRGGRTAPAWFRCSIQFSQGVDFNSESKRCAGERDLNAAIMEKKSLVKIRHEIGLDPGEWSTR